MDQGGLSKSRSLAQRAEALLRSLVGISHAEVRVHASGAVECVHVVPEGKLSPGQVVQNVRSALYAGLGLQLQVSQVELEERAVGSASPARAEHAQASTANGHALATAPSTPPSNGHHLLSTTEEPARHSNGNIVREVAAPSAASDAGSGPKTMHAGPRNGETIRLSGVRRLPAAEPAPERAHATLAQVELQRQRGRLRCRVVLVAEHDRFSAVAECMDEHAAELQLVGRATCDAARAGRLVQAQFEGVTVAYVGGAVHVVAAVHEWHAGRRVAASGSAPVSTSLEEAVARAVLQALKIS